MKETKMNRDFQEIRRTAENQTAEEMASECTFPELMACAASAREDRDFEMMRVFNKALRIQREMIGDLAATADGAMEEDEWEFNPNL